MELTEYRKNYFVYTFLFLYFLQKSTLFPFEAFFAQNWNRTAFFHPSLKRKPIKKKTPSVFCDLIMKKKLTTAHRWRSIIKHIKNIKKLTNLFLLTYFHSSLHSSTRPRCAIHLNSHNFHRWMLAIRYCDTKTIIQKRRRCDKFKKKKNFWKYPVLFIFKKSAKSN